MAITKIASARNCMKTIRYVKGSEKKPRCHIEGGQFINPEKAQEQFLMHIKAHGKLDNVHTYNIKISFLEDFDMTKEIDREKVRDFFEDFQKEAFPNRLVHYGVHTDGKGSKTHGHLTVSNVDLDGKCARDKEMSWTRLAPITDKICRKHNIHVLERDEKGLRYIEDFHERRVLKAEKGDNLSPTEEMMKRQGRSKDSYKEFVRECVSETLSQPDVHSLEDFKEYMSTTHEIEVVRGKRDLEYKMDWNGKNESITARKLGKSYTEVKIRELTGHNKQISLKTGLNTPKKRSGFVPPSEIELKRDYSTTSTKNETHLEDEKENNSPEKDFSATQPDPFVVYFEKQERKKEKSLKDYLESRGLNYESKFREMVVYNKDTNEFKPYREVSKNVHGFRYHNSLSTTERAFNFEIYTSPRKKLLEGRFNADFGHSFKEQVEKFAEDQGVLAEYKAEHRVIVVNSQSKNNYLKRE